MGRRPPRRYTLAMRRLQQVIGKPLEEELRRLYLDEGLTCEEIGQLWGRNPSTIWRWLKRLNIYDSSLCLHAAATGHDRTPAKSSG